MHDSFTALGGFDPMFNMQPGEVAFGGVGSGFYGIIYYAILTVFIAGLMVGRTPEYLGKKIERREVQPRSLAALVVPVFALFPAGIASVLPGGFGDLEQLRAATVSAARDPRTPTPRWSTTTGRRSPGFRPTRGGTFRAASRHVGPYRNHDPRCIARPVRWSASDPGSGSRSSSPTSPKRWPKGAARPRRHAARDEARHDGQARAQRRDRASLFVRAAHGRHRPRRRGRRSSPATAT